MDPVTSSIIGTVAAPVAADAIKESFKGFVSTGNELAKSGFGKEIRRIDKGLAREFDKGNVVAVPVIASISVVAKAGFVSTALCVGVLKGTSKAIGNFFK